MVFKAFFDDSGSGPPVFVLSGYVSNIDFWEAFAVDWQALLNELPRLPYFKMREAAQGFGGRMKRNDVAPRVAKFLKLIWCAAQSSFTSVIVMDDYAKVAKGNIKKEFDDPYFIAIFDVILKLIDIRDETNRGDVVEFTFDDNPRLAAKVPQWYRLGRALLPPELRLEIGLVPHFEDDKVFLPLQAADVQSWYFRRLFAERMNNEPFPDNLPKEMFYELDRIPCLLSVWNAERFNLLVQRGQPTIDQAPPRYKDIHHLLDALQASLKGS